jgi:alkylated DNA repair dioxygenase AlkB
MSKRKLCEFSESKDRVKTTNESASAQEVVALEEDLTVSIIRSKGVHVEYISENSWVAVAKGFLPPEDTEFDELWGSHPTEFDVKIPRYQQAYGRSYQYSGIESHAITETALISRLKDRLNELISIESEPMEYAFNMCLCNWYEPEHYIGPHSDDTRQLVPQSPIAGLSWGCPRVFTLSPRFLKKPNQIKKSIKMESGDLIIMGGDCQLTHKHEIEKLKKGDTRGNRVSFTFRCFR